MTGKEYGQRPAFTGPFGITLRDWLYGIGFQGIMASGKRPGTAEIAEWLRPLVDALLEELAKAHQSAER